MRMSWLRVTDRGAGTAAGRAVIPVGRLCCAVCCGAGVPGPVCGYRFAAALLMAEAKVETSAYTPG